MAPVASKKNVGMVRLTKDQIKQKVAFVEQYIGANNAADGSTFDPNSNVTNKNVATLGAELNKDINIQTKRALVYKYIEKEFGTEIADSYIRQLENHEIYTHDETSIMPYCMAVSLYPFLLDGLKAFGGESKAPKHLSSFNGGFTNLIFALSSQIAGAVATVEYLMYFDYFAKKDYGNDYLTTHTETIKQELQQVVYALNQPASARGFQSPFWNVSIFDEYYFNALFGTFVFPDGTKSDWESLDRLQQYFLKWFNKERTQALLTFPVVTVAMLNDGKEMVDKRYKDIVATELSEGNSFFIYTSTTVDSLSSCCRLRNSIVDQLNEFSYSLGAGGVMSGSVNVITLNMNRFIQNILNTEEYEEAKHFTIIEEALTQQVALMHKYQVGHRKLFDYFKANKMLPANNAGYIDFDKQFLTIGLNGLLEGAEYLGYTPNNNSAYKSFVGNIHEVIGKENKRGNKLYGYKFNTEIVPAESLGVKFATWDKKDDYIVPRDCYNSYLYRVEDEELTILDKFTLHGSETTSKLDGGSACHLNLEDTPSKETCNKLLDIAVITGCPYFCINVKVTICNACNHIDKHTNRACVKCGSTDIDYATRIIGYLRRITNFSKPRQAEAAERFYHG